MSLLRRLASSSSAESSSHCVRVRNYYHSWLLLGGTWADYSKLSSAVSVLDSVTAAAAVTRLATIPSAFSCRLKTASAAAYSL